MTDSRFQSVHLEGLPRRDEFRAAREKLHAACGHQTLYGEFAELPPDDPGDGLTATIAPGQLKAASFWLQDGDHVHQLSVGVNSVGRLPDNQVVLRDEHVSRRHCAIVVHRDGRCEVHDVASKNGTLVNGRKIASATALKPGDVLLLCTRKLTFLAGPQPDPKPAACSDDGQSWGIWNQSRPLASLRLYRSSGSTAAQSNSHAAATATTASAAPGSTM